MTRPNPLPLLLGLLLLIWAPVPLLGQSMHDVIRGRVTTDSGQAVPNATVRVLRAPDRAQKDTTTDANGQFVVEWQNGTGEYLITVAAEGLPTVSRRLTRSTGDTLVFDVLLTNRPRAQQLPAVRTQAQRPAPTRNDDPVVGGTSDNANQYHREAPDLVGDITALTAMVPGVVSTPSGNSVLGLAPSQNSVTLNGMSFAGAQVPRDVQMRVAVSASGYDPSNGWFSGTRTNVYMPSSQLFSIFTGHLTVDQPSLQSSDPIASRLGQRYKNVNGSLGMSGEILDDKFDYNFGLQGGRKTADVASLLTADPALLAHEGVASDSVTHLLQLLQGAHIPALAGAPTTSLNDNVVFLGRIDHARYNWQTLQPSPTTWGLIGYGSYTHNQAQGLSPIGTPAHAGENTQQIGALTGEYSFFFHKDYLGDVRSGLTLVHNDNAPYVQLPDGRVLVTSNFADGSAGSTPLSFGGNSGMNTSSRAWTWESMSELQFYPAGLTKHRIKLTADSRLDGYNQDVFTNQLGTFSFNSLNDVASNTPASFTRTLNAPVRTGGEWNGFLALGDLWRASQNLQLVYGARLEGSAFTAIPASNPAVANQFGVPTNEAPELVHVSPRLGFTWNSVRPGGQTRGTLRGGIGEFRNLLDPTLLANPSVSTGLPAAFTRLTCIGSAVPTPDWAAYDSSSANVPTQCIGSTPTYADTAPNVQVISPSYEPQRSWRSNLSWNGGLWGRSAYNLEGIYSLNLNQPGSVDLNFIDTLHFTTSDEGRLVFARSSSIVPSTGVVSSVDARRSSNFGHVVESVSDLQSYTEQFRAVLRPDLGPLGEYLRDPTVYYVLSTNRSLQRGFNGSTFASPTLEEWARGDFDVRHQFTFQTIFWPLGARRNGPGFFFYGHVQSGLPFTPIVATDVNGDGLANDRAFIFNPLLTTTDATVAGGIRQLQNSGSKQVRDCINSQIGQAAGRSSCEGPWTATLNLDMVLNGDAISSTLDRFQISLNFTNPLGGLDQLLHGSNNLHGWGAPATPDPVLYNVRGFDAVNDRFLYTVNPRFGTTSPSLTTLRAPFRLTLDISMDLARPLVDQQLDRWLRPGRAGRPGPRLTVDQLTQRLQRNVPDPYNELLQQQDSLLLTQDQVTKLQAARTTYRSRVDSVWRDLATYLNSAPDAYDFSQVSKHMDDAVDNAWELTRLDVRAKYVAILAPEQLAILPGWSRQLYQAQTRLHVRLFVQ